MTINHISEYKKGSNQFEKKLKDGRFLKNSTCKSIGLLSLFLVPVIWFSAQTAEAGQSAQLAKHVREYSPIPMTAYVMMDPTPSPIIEEKIVYTTTPAEVRQESKKQFSKKEWPAAEKLINQESGFNPLAVNKSSGACSLAQALPCSKLKCELIDVSCQINWIKKYTNDRYVSFDNAWEFHLKNDWY